MSTLACLRVSLVFGSKKGSTLRVSSCKMQLTKADNMSLEVDSKQLPKLIFCATRITDFYRLIPIHVHQHIVKLQVIPIW